LSDQSTRLLKLVDAEGPRLYRLLARLTLREDVADDLLQELVVRLSQADGFQRADDAFAYARRAAIHLAFDWRRGGKRRRRTEPLGEAPTIPAPNLLGKLVDREDLERVLAALEGLSQLSRSCLVLHYMEQLSYTEVAEQLDMTPHQVRAACHKGIRRLRKMMGAEPSSPAHKEASDEAL
jgi:RNA polymerase sigma-70 factor (ECF subfamily)